jgi:membrane protease YdiL (CAAX protease family)
MFSTLGLIATTGEEFAWRGFLQGHLEHELGVLPAILTVAAIWWLWHLPGLLAGYNFPETPILGAFVLFPLQMIGASLFLGWLTIRANSFWPAALAHGAVNSIQQGVIDNLQPYKSLLYVDFIRTIFILVAGLILTCSPGIMPSVS